MADDTRKSASERTRARIAARKAARKAARDAAKAGAKPAGDGAAAGSVQKKTSASKKTSGKKTTRKTATSEKTTTRKSATKKTASKKTASKKSTRTETASKKAATRKASSKKATGKTATSKKATGKTPASKTSAASTTVTGKAPAAARKTKTFSKSNARPAADGRPTVMVTGAAGALARQVIAQLRKDRNIVAVDFRRRVRIDGDTPSYQGDPNKRVFEDVFRQHKIDGVIHLGRVDSDELTPERRYNANVLGTQRLFQLCSRYGVKKMVVMSTFFVYGASPYNPALLGEDAPLKASGLTMDLIDSVELENLAAVALWKHPELHMTVLRPCNIAGPRVRNTMSQLMDRPVAPHLLGFSPMMQFIHVDDMARAVVSAYTQNKPGIYNVAPDQWMAYQDVLRACGCASLPVPSIPPAVPSVISRLLRWRAFPRYLVNYLKYPVLIDGGHFERTFGFQHERSLDDVLSYYRQRKNTPV